MSYHSLQTRIFSVLKFTIGRYDVNLTHPAINDYINDNITIKYEPIEPNVLVGGKSNISDTCVEEDFMRLGHSKAGESTNILRYEIIHDSTLDATHRAERNISDGSDREDDELRRRVEARDKNGNKCRRLKIFTGNYKINLKQQALDDYVNDNDDITIKYEPLDLNESFPNDSALTGKEEVKSDQEVQSKPSSHEENIVCSECGKLVKYRHYDVHVKTHGYKCKQYPKSFDLDVEIHNNNSFACSICNINFANALAFSIHSQEHSGVYKCPLCSFETTTKASMKPHIKLLHMKEYKRVCEICGKGFLNNATYTDHMALHSCEKKYQCDYCDKKFVLSRYLDMHKKLNHKDIISGVEEQYACQVCKRTFKFETSLIRHLRCIHDIGTSKRVVCPVCNKMIANNYGLKIHMRMHSGEKPYICEVCDARFVGSKYLQRHIVKHVK